MTNFGIIALDPGGTTGWATFRADLMPDGSLAGAQWNRGQLDTHDHHHDLWCLLELEAVQNFTVVCESFEYRNDSRPGLVLDSREYIGVAKLFAQARSYPIKMQTASMGKVTKKSFVKKENLERLGLWYPGNVHAMDATGHMLYYMIHGLKNEFPTLRSQLLVKGWKPGS